MTGQATQPVTPEDRPVVTPDVIARGIVLAVVRIAVVVVAVAVAFWIVVGIVGAVERANENKRLADEADCRTQHGTIVLEDGGGYHCTLPTYDLNHNGSWDIGEPQP